MAGDRLLGYVVTDSVIGKFELIDYAVALTPDGADQATSRSSPIAKHTAARCGTKAWRNQFVGKTADAPLAIGDDIANISGATLSCTHLTDGIRRIATFAQAGARQGLSERRAGSSPAAPRPSPRSYAGPGRCSARWSTFASRPWTPGDRATALAAAFAEIATVHRLMSFHEAGSDLAAAESGAPGAPVSRRSAHRRRPALRRGAARRHRPAPSTARSPRR